MKVLVTGSSGFVGRNLLPYLKSYHTIETITRAQLQSFSAGLIADNKIIVHLAGKAHDLKNASNPQEYDHVNFQLTKLVYKAFLTSNAEKFIFLSSVKAAADTVTGVLTEDVVPSPQTQYGKSKLMAEEFIISQPLPPGKSYYILRPCMIHGPGNKGNLNLLYKVVKKRVPYPLAAFNNSRSYLSVQNLCFVINQLINANNIASGVYNVADDEALSTKEVVAILAASINSKALLWNIPVKVVRFLAKLGNVLNAPLTTERLNKLTESYIVSNGKITSAIKKPLPLGAAEGLKITAQSFSNELNG